MVYYFQRENRAGAAVAAGSVVLFDTALAQSGNDFLYRDDGSIDILRAGTYTVFWNVSAMTSMSTVGQGYEIRRMDYSLASPAFARVAGATNHIKASQTTGFAAFKVTAAEIGDYGRATLALFNIADDSVGYSFFAPKAGIMIFGCDFDYLEERMTLIDTEIAATTERLVEIDNFLHLSDMTEMWSADPTLGGLGAAVIKSGYTFNFWGIGTLNQQQTLVPADTYYLITAAQFPPLALYQGDSTISTLWIETPGPASLITSQPIRFDATGIYFMPSQTYANLPPGTIFRFTQSLILVEPAARS